MPEQEILPEIRLETIFKPLMHGLLRLDDKKQKTMRRDLEEGQKREKSLTAEQILDRIRTSEMAVWERYVYLLEKTREALEAYLETSNAEGLVSGTKGIIEGIYGTKGAGGKKEGGLMQDIQKNTTTDPVTNQFYNWLRKHLTFTLVHIAQAISEDGESLSTVELLTEVKDDLRLLHEEIFITDMNRVQRMLSETEKKPDTAKTDITVLPIREGEELP